MASMEGTWASVLSAALASWMGLLLWIYRMEARLLFGRPRRLRSAPRGPFDLHLVQHVTQERDGTPLDGVLARPVADALGANGSTAHTLVLWFGGRNEDVRWTPAIASWLGSGHAVAAFTYRVRPTQAQVLADALHALDWLLQEPRFHGARLVLAGRSLGTAVALQVAAALPSGLRLAGMVLVSPMDSVRAMVARNLFLAPLARWMRSPFDSLSVAHSTQCPVLVLLAQHDRRVPHARSNRLVEQLRRHRPLSARTAVQVRVVDGTDHRSVARSPSALQAIAGFVDGL